MKTLFWKTLALAALALLLREHESRAQTNFTLYAFTNFAGRADDPGYRDGAGNTARFSWPNGVAVDSAGNVYVADNLNRRIRKITPSSDVTTLAGSGEWGNTDGAGNEVRFHYLGGLGVDKDGNVYAATTPESGAGTIRKITPAGVVTTLAGSPEEKGSADGPGGTARFDTPASAAVDNAGNIYVADTFNHTIRKIAPSGLVATLAGRAQESGSADGVGSAARFSLPTGVAVDSAGNVYVSDGNHTIRKITPGGVVSTLAGRVGEKGSVDGVGSAARFSGPFAEAVDNAGNLYVTDGGNHTIRKISPAGVVTTLAGSAGQSGATEGIASAARFSRFGLGLAVDSVGIVYVADSHRISKGMPVSIPQPRFGTFSIAGGLLTATLSDLVMGTSVVLESSANLRDWLAIQTNTASGASLSVRVAVDVGTRARFVRALVK